MPNIIKTGLTIVLACSLQLLTLISFANPAPVYDADALIQEPSTATVDESAEQLSPTSAKVVSQNTPAPVTLSTEQRLRRLEQQMRNLQTNTNSDAKMQALQDQVQTLQNTVDELSHQLQQLAAQPPVVVTSKKPVKAAQINEPSHDEEQQIYQSAYTFIKAKKYAQAVTVLQTMLKKYPNGEFSASAHYWLGELYGLLGKNAQALAEFTTVVKSYPQNARVSDSQLKMGLIFAADGKWKEARSAFTQVIHHYPGTATARLATQQLQQLKLAGH